LGPCLLGFLWSLDAPARSQQIGRSINANCSLSAPPIGVMSSACLINHSQFVHTSNMCESLSSPPQRSIPTGFSKSVHLLHGSLSSHTEATYLVRSVICNLICNVCIGSSSQNYSTDIVHFRLTHLQQSSSVHYRHCSIPTSASATVFNARTLRFLRIFVHVSSSGLFPNAFSYYMQPSTLQYVHCFISTCASAAVVKSTVQTSFNSDLRKCSSR
jgi:hypothetical protein